MIALRYYVFIYPHMLNKRLIEFTALQPSVSFSPFLPPPLSFKDISAQRTISDVVIM